MTKKLKIRFVKFEKALVMQVMEQVGEFKRTEHVRISVAPVLSSSWICSRGSNCDCNLRPVSFVFTSNTERDEYLNKVVKWISEEQFTENGRLEVGKLCDVSDDNKDWQKRILLAVLPESYFSKYIASVKYSDFKWCSWKYARPIGSCVQPKIDGDIYTWEMEVAE